MMIPQAYINSVKDRTTKRYIVGLLIRFVKNIKFSIFRKVATYRGASICDSSNITWKIAKNANKNLIIGEDCVIEAEYLDLRGGKIIIHDHVVINKEVAIIRVSHNIDNDRCYSTRYFQDLNICSYSWLATGCKILPQVTIIDEGAICGAYSVISKNCEPDGVYVGNPAKCVRNHNTRFDNLVVCSLQGGDFKAYKKAREL